MAAAAKSPRKKKAVTEVDPENPGAVVEAAPKANRTRKLSVIWLSQTKTTNSKESVPTSTRAAFKANAISCMVR